MEICHVSWEGIRGCHLSYPGKKLEGRKIVPFELKDVKGSILFGSALFLSLCN